MAPLPVLVTGGAGYIGAHACKALAENGFLPIAYDNLSAGHATRVQFGPLETGDIRDASRLNAVIAAYKPVAIMHFAALISVPDSVQNPQETWDVNTVGSHVLFSAAKTHGIKHIVFSSTAAVYGTPTTVPIAETAPKAPINPYGQSKLAMETMLADFAAAYGITYAALRYFNAAGATPEAGLGYDRAAPFHLIPLALLATLGKRPPLQLFGSDYPTPDGTAVRDYIHVADLSDAHVKALQHLLAGKPSLTLNLGTSHGYSVKEVVETCARVTGHPVPHAMAPRRAGDPAELVADATAAHALLGWNPTRSSLENIIATDWAWHHQRHS